MSQNGTAEDKLNVITCEALAILDQMPGYIYIVDERLRLVHCNHAMKDLFGEYKQGDSCYDIICQSKYPCNSCPISVCDEQNSAHVNVIRGQSGEYYRVSAKKAMLNDEKVFFLTSVPLDENPQDMADNIDKDELTGLIAYPKLLKKLRALMENACPCEYSVIVFDINNFKYINETFGYDIGNKVLHLVADAVGSGNFEDMYFSRSYADNFALVIKTSYIQNSIWDVIDVANIRKHISKYLDSSYPFNISCGIFLADNPKMPVSTMFDCAGEAKKKAKQQFESGYFLYSDKLSQELKTKREITLSMKRALKEGEFIPYFQPKFSFLTGQIVGAELLVRWISPSKGMIYPNVFIPVFESCGFIYELDCYMFEKACQATVKLKKMFAQGKCPRLSVNLSRASLIVKDIVEQLVAIAQKNDIEPKEIEIELTENVLADHKLVVISTMHKFSQHGFILSIDDFGSEYSSLNVLKDLPAQVVKLDRAFFTEDAITDKSYEIIESIIFMAKKLHLETVAEGVETELQENQLRLLGCDIAQGYRFARPMPWEDFDALIKSRKKSNLTQSLDSQTKRSINRAMADKFVEINKTECSYWDNMKGAFAILKIFVDQNQVPYDYVFMYANQALAEVKGILLEDLIGMSFTEQYDTADHYWLHAYAQTAYNGTRHELRRKDDLHTNGFDVFCYQYSFGYCACLVNELDTSFTTSSNDHKDLLSSIYGGLATYVFDKERGSFFPEYISKSWEQLTGYTAEEIRLSFLDNRIPIYHEDDEAYVKMQYLSSVINKTNWEFSYRMRRIDASIMWVIDRGGILADDDKVVVQSMITDITMIKENEFALKKANFAYSGLLANIQGGVCQGVYSAEAKAFIYNYVSSGFEGMTGYSSEVFLNKFGGNLTKIIHPDDVESAEKSFLDQTNGNDNYKVQYRIIAEDGKVIWVIDSGSITYEEDAKLLNQCILTDVTNIKEQEQKAQISDARFRLTLSMTANTVFEYDLKTMTYVAFLNCQAMFGYSEEEIAKTLHDNGPVTIEKTCLDFYHADDVPAVLTAIRYLFENNSAVCEARIRRKDGKYLWAEVSYILHPDEHGERNRVLGYIKDIERQRRAVTEAKHFGKVFEMISRRMFDSVMQADLSTDRITSNNLGDLAQEANGKVYTSNIESIVNSRIHPKYKEEYKNLFCRKSLVLKYFEGQNFHSIEVLDNNGTDNYTWMRTELHVYKSEMTGSICLIAYSKDIDEKKKREDLIKLKLQTDGLTGVYNKQATAELIKKQLELYPRSNHAYILIDLDNFREINSQRGHIFGDSVLTTAGERLRKLFREDDIVGRIGGDEFAVFLRAVSGKNFVEDKAEEIRQAIHFSYEDEQGVHNVSCSIGVAFWESCDNLQQLYAHAGTALFRAKALGKDGFWVYSANEPALAQMNLNTKNPGNLGQNDIKTRMAELINSKSDFYSSVTVALALLGSYYNASRVYTFENTTGGIFKNTFEWCDRNILSLKEFRGAVNFEELGLFGIFNQDGILNCPNTATLKGAPNDFFSSYGIKATFQALIYANGAIYGIIGIENCNQTNSAFNDDVETLHYMAKLIGALILKHRADQNVAKLSLN